MTNREQENPASIVELPVTDGKKTGMVTRILTSFIVVLVITVGITVFIYDNVVQSPSLGAIGWDTCSVVTVRIPDTSPGTLTTAATQAVSDWNSAGSPVILFLKKEPLPNEDITNPPDGTISLNTVSKLPTGTDPRALAIATPIADPFYRHIVSGYILLSPEANGARLTDIIEHELGHILGLGHEPHGIMNPIMMGDVDAQHEDANFIKAVTPDCPTH